MKTPCHKLFITITSLALFASLSLQAEQTAPLTKTSFTEVTKHLDPGGSVYAYLSTEEVLRNIDDYVAKFGEFILKTQEKENATPQQIDQARFAISLVKRILKDSGLNEISGVGFSSIKESSGYHSNKMFIHHYPGNGKGLLWGTGVEAGTPLNLLPAQTALAIFGSSDLSKCWNWFLDLTKDTPIEAPLQQALEQSKSEIDVQQLIDSIGPHNGYILSLNPNKNVEFQPDPASPKLSFPEPSLAFIINTKTGYLQNWIEGQIVSKQVPITTETIDGVETKQIAMPIPLPFQVIITLAQIDNYFILTSHPDLLRDIRAVMKGGPGLKDNADFQQIATGLPTATHEMMYLAPSAGQIFIDLQQTVIEEQPEAKEIFELFYGSLSRQPMAVYSVTEIKEDGILNHSRTTSSGGQLMLTQMSAVPIGIAAAIAIPAFTKARTTAQNAACINNLRQINLAYQQYFIETGKTEVPPLSSPDLLAYFGNETLPVCSKGGSYAPPANDSDVPTCSLAEEGHAL